MNRSRILVCIHTHSCVQSLELPASDRQVTAQKFFGLGRICCAIFPFRPPRLQLLNAWQVASENAFLSVKTMRVSSSLRVSHLNSLRKCKKQLACAIREPHVASHGMESYIDAHK